MALVIATRSTRDLAQDLGEVEREQVLIEKFGSRPGFDALVPSRDEWVRP